MRITLATLPQATAQQVFDQVALHLLTQNAKSTGYSAGNESGCLYRSPAGLMCAAGCLISDDEYDSAWENVCWTDIYIIPAAHKSLINQLQTVHDSHEVDEWHDELIGVADLFNLSPAVVTNFGKQS